MNYYISTRFSINRYHAFSLTAIAMVRQDGKELFMENVAKAKFKKAIRKFTDDDNTQFKFYSYRAAGSQIAFGSLELSEFTFIDFRDLKFLEDYISEKVNSDFSVKEDSKYPFQEIGAWSALQDAFWMKKLHEFLIAFDKRINLSYNSGKDVPTGPNFRSMYGNYTTKTEN